MARQQSHADRLTPEQALARIRRGDKDAAWAWLDQVGSYGSDDPDTRATTAAANRLLGLRSNPMSSTKIVVGALALAGAGIGIGVAIGRLWPRRVQPPVGAPTPSPYPQLPPHPEGSGTAVEPEEGWEARWEAKRNLAIGTCRRDTDVTTWPQAVTCLLELAYPEASPWNDPSTWLPWQQDAAKLVTQDLTHAISQTFGSTDPQGWELQLWLRGARTIGECHRQGIVDEQQLALCVAGNLYPQLVFPPPLGVPLWVNEFWIGVRKFVHEWKAPTPMGLHIPAQHT